MNGLNKILAKIEEDNLLEVNRIKEDAKALCDKIISDAETAAKAEAEDIVALSSKKTSQMLENAKSGCDVLVRRAEAAARAEVVEEYIKSAALKLKSMPDDAYFNVIKKLILKYCHHNEQGELLMSPKDVKRIPEKFIEDINKEIKKYGASVVLSENTADTDGGFVICYGGIDENCTFDSLINEKMDEIKDMLYSRIMG